jgi:hypothetical protein
MNKLLIASMALVTVFSTPALAMPGPGSPRGFATFQTYRGMRKRILSIVRCSLPNKGTRVGTLPARSTILIGLRFAELLGRRPPIAHH